MFNEFDLIIFLKKMIKQLNKFNYHLTIKLNNDIFNEFDLTIFSKD